MRSCVVKTAAMAALLALASPAQGQGLELLLLAPKTLIDRAIEARSAADIAKDNDIAIKVNAAMAKVGTIKASTEIYEQRLLVTGLFDDKAVYEKFEKSVRAVKGVKRLYWHVVYMSPAEQAKQKTLDWGSVMALQGNATMRLIGTSGVADVNFRVTADSTGTLYVLGRARSAEEMDKAVKRLRDGENVKKVVNYIQVRP